MRESTLWMWHIFAGVIVFVLLGIHMLIMHLDSILVALGVGYENVLSAESVFARSKQVFFLITYVLLLGAALYHGLYGLRNILFELTLPRGVEVVVSIVLLLAGAFLFIYGSYAAIAVFGMSIA